MPENPTTAVKDIYAFDNLIFPQFDPFYFQLLCEF